MEKYPQKQFAMPVIGSQKNLRSNNELAISKPGIMGGDEG